MPNEKLDVQFEGAINDLSPGVRSAMSAQARLNVLNPWSISHLKVAQINVLAPIVDFVGRLLQVLNNDKVRVEHHAIGHPEEVPRSILSHVHQRVTAAIRNSETGCGIDGAINKEFHALWLVFVTPMEWLPVFGSQGQSEV